MFRMTQKEAQFFDVFESASEIAHQAAVILQELVLDYRNVEAKIEELDAKEHAGDQLVHAMMDRLNKSFITPMDREDLFLISKELDDITDRIESTGHLFTMFDIAAMKEDAKKFVELIAAATRELHDLTKELQRFKKSDQLKPKVIEINRIENEGDRLFRKAVHALYTEEKDPLEVMKWKEVYEYLESALDSCEHVANVILGVVVKHA